MDEERFRLAAEAAELGTWDMNALTGELDWDVRTKALFGLPPDATIDYSVFVLGLHPDDREKIDDINRRLLRGEDGGHYDVEYRTVGLQDGIERWVAATGHTITDSNGRVVRYIGTARDITAQKRVESENAALLSALTGSERDQRELADAMPQIVFTSSARDGRITYINRRWYEYTGLYESDPNDDWLAVTHPDDRSLLEHGWRDAFANGQLWEAEYRIRRHDGEWRWHLGRSVPARESDIGPVVRWVGSATDITERKRAEERIRRIFDSAVVGVIFWNLDADLITDANDTFLTMVGYSREDLAAGRLNFRAMTPSEWNDRNELGLNLLRADGFAPAYEKEYFHKDGSRIPILIGGTRFQDSPAEGFSFILDISERKRVEVENIRLLGEARRHAERESLLSEVSTLLSQSLDYQETLAAIAGIVVPRFADWCSVDLRDPEGALQRVAVTHVDPDKAAWGWELSRRYPTQLDAPHGVPLVLRTGKSSYVPEITDAMMAGAGYDEEHLSLLRRIGMTCVMIVPLINGGSVLGTLSFIGTNESGRRFSEDDLRLAEEIGRRGALAIQNSRLFRATQDAEAKQRRIAETLQRSLLLAPPEGSFPGLAVHPYYEAATEEAMLGGDLFDVFALADGKVAMVVGDATGKSISAAIEVASYQFTARAYLRLDADPVAALRRMNQHIFDRQALDGRPESAMLCMTIAVLETRTGELTVCSAGMEPPLVVRSETGVVEEILSSGPVLGAIEDWSADAVTLRLGEGDLLLLYTDGLSEARPGGRGGKFHGTDGVIRSLQEALPLRSLDRIAASVVNSAKEFGGGSLGDDVCLLLARYLP